MSAYNHSSVPSINHDDSNNMSRAQSEKMVSDMDAKHNDSILMYCSYFTYCDRSIFQRKEMCETNVQGILDVVNKYSSAGKISSNSKSALFAFLEAGDASQREILDSPNVSGAELRDMFYLEQKDCSIGRQGLLWAPQGWI